MLSSKNVKRPYESICSKGVDQCRRVRRHSTKCICVKTEKSISKTKTYTPDLTSTSIKIIRGSNKD